MCAVCVAPATMKHCIQSVRPGALWRNQLLRDHINTASGNIFAQNQQLYMRAPYLRRKRSAAARQPKGFMVTQLLLRPFRYQLHWCLCVCVRVCLCALLRANCVEIYRRYRGDAMANVHKQLRVRACAQLVSPS